MSKKLPITPKATKQGTKKNMKKVKKTRTIRV